MKKLLLLSLILFLLVLTGCTENQQAKTFGGTSEYYITPNNKVINVTWKESNLWVLTRPMTEKDSAETYNFKEKSDYGVLEGQYIIKETKVSAPPQKLSYYDSIQKK